MRSFALALFLVACGEPAGPSTVAAPPIDRTPSERPAGTVLEVSFDGGDAAFGRLIAQLPPSALRSGLPSRISVVVDGLLDTPSELHAQIATDSPLRLIMARVDGELRSAIAVRLDAPLAQSERRGGGPRGSDRVGTLAAVDDRIAVVSDDAALLDLAFPYLAYGALTQPSDDGVIVAHVPASTVGTTLRSALEHAVLEQHARALASIAAARAAHDRPPDLGDPEALVTLLSAAVITRLAYLPDLGDVTLRLSPTPSGLSLSLAADVTDASPLAEALADRTSVSPALLAAMPTSAMIALATGTTAQARATSEHDLAESVATIGGSRISTSERASLDRASTIIETIRGDQAALAIGAADTGPFVITATRGGTATAAPALWGRALPWTTQLFGALFSCTPSAARSAASGTVLCGDVALVTQIDAEVRTDAIAHDASSLAAPVHASLAHDDAATSPDLARDLAALPSSTFAALIVRPLRVLPWLALFGGPTRSGLPRGDGAAVLAFAHEGGHLQIMLRASSAAMSDLDVMVRLFADDSDSE